MNLLVTGLNLPFESPPQSITQLSYALATFDRSCAMVKISGFGEVPVLYCKRLLIILASVTLIQEPLKPLRFHIWVIIYGIQAMLKISSISSRASVLTSSDSMRLSLKLLVDSNDIY